MIQQLINVPSLTLQSSTVPLSLLSAHIVARISFSHLASNLIGPLNTLLLCTTFSAAILFAWLAVKDSTGLYVIAVLYGATSGGILATVPTAIQSFCFQEEHFLPHGTHEPSRTSRSQTALSNPSTPNTSASITALGFEARLRAQLSARFSIAIVCIGLAALSGPPIGAMLLEIGPKSGLDVRVQRSSGESFGHRYQLDDIGQGIERIETGQFLYAQFFVAVAMVAGAICFALARIVRLRLWANRA